MNNKLIPIKEAAKLLGVTMTTLRRWDEAGTLKAVRAGEKGHRYYRKRDIDLFIQDLSSTAWEWVSSQVANDPESDYYCPNSAVFQARLEKLRSALLTVEGMESLHSLIVAVAGEIGNNSYDHNLGNWPDVIGIFFGYDPERREIVLADRGIGILSSLSRVRSELTTDEEALKVAFTERITGREPESRGNDLKFVRKIVCEYPLVLDFRTGNARLNLKKGDNEIDAITTDELFRGCYAIIKY